MKSAVPLFMLKKIIYPLIVLFFVPAFFKAQRHEIGVQLGMSNVVGDIGNANYILQKPAMSNIRDYGIPFYGGILYRMNFNPYQTVRLNVGYSHVQFADEFAKEEYRYNRKLWGTNSIIHADLVFEYNFLPVNDEQKSMLSPYIFGGLGGFIASTPQLIVEADFNRDGNGKAVKPLAPDDFVITPTYTSGKKMGMSVPFGVGLKYKFNYNWAVFGELMFRPTFSDAIDYSVIEEKSMKISYNKDILAEGSKTKSLLQENPYKEVVEAKAAELLKDRQIGNINSKDWVNSISIGVSYSFGRPPCYCE